MRKWPQTSFSKQVQWTKMQLLKARSQHPKHKQIHQLVMHNHNHNQRQVLMFLKYLPSNKSQLKLKVGKQMQTWNQRPIIIMTKKMMPEQMAEVMQLEVRVVVLLYYE